MSRLKALGMAVGVSLPSLLMAPLSADAVLVAAGDVLLISLVQIVFIIAFVGYLFRQTSS